MARRTQRREARRDARAGRGPSLGAHWRADGSPKTAYRSEREAWAMADERRLDSGAQLTVYRCDFCTAWHLGNAGGRAE